MVVFIDNLYYNCLIKNNCILSGGDANDRDYRWRKGERENEAFIR